MEEDISNLYKIEIELAEREKRDTFYLQCGYNLTLILFKILKKNTSQNISFESILKFYEMDSHILFDYVRIHGSEFSEMEAINYLELSTFKVLQDRNENILKINYMDSILRRSILIDKSSLKIGLSPSGTSFSSLVNIIDSDELLMYEKLYGMKVDKILMDTPWTLYKGLEEIKGKKVLITTNNYEVEVTEIVEKSNYVVVVNGTGERKNKYEYKLLLSFSKLIENILRF